MMKRTLIALQFVLVTGCLLAIPAGAQTKVETIEVAHYRAFCEGVVPKKCLVIKRADSKNFGTIFDEIENFDFIPGYHYSLKVEIEKVNAPPKDTSGYVYRLKEIVNRKEISDSDQDTYLYGTKWRLVSIGGKPVNEAAGAWAVFQGHAGAVYGYGGCNSFRGNFSAYKDGIRSGGIAATQAACLIDWGVEDAFLKALAEANAMTVEPDSLVLIAGGRAVLEFKPYE